MRALLTGICALGGAAAAVVAVWRFGGTWALVPFAAAVPVSAALAWIDLTAHRLPNRIVVPALAASMVLLLGSAAGDGEPARWVGAVVGGVVLFGLYLLLALMSPNGMGMGDVKLAALVGMFGGYLGPTGWMLAAAGAFVAGGLAALTLALTQRNAHARLPFGPWMLLGLWSAVAVTG